MSNSVTLTIHMPEDLQNLFLLLRGRSEYPFTVNVKKGEPKRTEKQNRLMWEWFNDAQKQGDQTASEYRAFCKLHFGVPVLRESNEAFREQYDEVVKPLPYDKKLAIMLPPIELPVTSIMTVKQKTRLLDMIWQHFTGNGFRLTDPSQLGLEDCLKR